MLDWVDDAPSKWKAIPLLCLEASEVFHYYLPFIVLWKRKFAADVVKNGPELSGARIAGFDESKDQALSTRSYQGSLSRSSSITSLKCSFLEAWQCAAVRSLGHRFDRLRRLDYFIT
jgi:hypothetical protein